MKLRTPTFATQTPTNQWADDNASLAEWDHGFERYQRWAGRKLNRPSVVVTDSGEFDILSRHLLLGTPVLCLHLSEDFELDADTLGQIAPSVAHWTSEDGHVADVVLTWKTDAWLFLVLASAIDQELRQQYTSGGAPIVVIATVGSRTALSMFKVDECAYQDLASPDEFIRGNYDDEGRLVVLLQPHSYRMGK